jgi:hypothetical protein
VIISFYLTIESKPLAIKFILFTSKLRWRKSVYESVENIIYLYGPRLLSRILFQLSLNRKTPEGRHKSRRNIYVVTLNKLVFSHKLSETYSFIRYTPP